LSLSSSDDSKNSKDTQKPKRHKTSSSTNSKKKNKEQSWIDLLSNVESKLATDAVTLPALERVTGDGAATATPLDTDKETKTKEQTMTEEDVWSVLLAEEKKHVKQMSNAERTLAMQRVWKDRKETSRSKQLRTVTADEMAYIGMIAQVQDKLARIDNPHKVQLAVDAKEGAVWPFVQWLCDVYADNTHHRLIVREELAPGDFHFRIGDVTVFAIERKALRDLSSAKKSERFGEQRARLLNANFPRNQIMYLFEYEPHLYSVASLPQVQYMLTWDEILNTESRMRHRDGMQAYVSPHVLATVLMLLKDLENLVRYASELIVPSNNAGASSSNNNGSSSNTNNEEQVHVRLYNPCRTCQADDAKAQANQAAAQYATKLRVSKKEKLTPEIFLQKCLMHVPRVTAEAAVKIVEDYGSMHFLLEAYEKYKGDPEHMLQGISYTPKGRTEDTLLGKVRSANIYRLLHGEPLLESCSKRK